MKILAIETSTGHGSVALIEDGSLKFETTSKEPKSHSEVVHSFIEQGLSELNWKISDIDLFASTTGPGSFTGIRVSINSAKSFAFTLKKPIVGIDSLFNLACTNLELLLIENSEVSQITCMINAYKNMVYLGQYSLKGGRVFTQTHPTVVRVQDLGGVITEPTWVVGDGFTTYESHFDSSVKSLCRRTTEIYDFPSARMTGQTGVQLWTESKATSTFEWNLISPLYLRASEAEENKKGIKYTPL